MESQFFARENEWTSRHNEGTIHLLTVMNVHYSRGRGESSGYVGAIEPHLVGLYEAPPQEELSMKEFEQLSFNRLTGGYPWPP